MARARVMERRAAVAALGKTLTRRAGSRCELCGQADDLRPLEVPPLPDEPSDEAAILACGRCRALVDARALAPEADQLRFVESAVYADPVPVRLIAIRLLRQLALEGVGWAEDALDHLWVPEELEALL